ncbi:MAG: hypothetical protein L3K26_19755, partial [Candidatus Hydrogenedentes bacterium]|nr:hypothetical protein [Candidatus Hydrogenedentota bacterium]
SGGGGGIVLVAGLEEWPAPPVKVTRAVYATGLKKLVAPANCLVDSGAFYQFVYPPGYEALLDVSVWEEVHPRFQGLRATFAVGAGTDMYNALALLSETLGVTVIADNAIADVWCGELFLYDAPAATIVEALLQSARVVPGAFVVESAEHYIFLRSTDNMTKSDTCVNRDGLSPDARVMLEKTVDLRLPTRDGTLVFQYEAMPLQAVLDDLAEQMGVAVTADAVLADFPVNQAVYLGLPISDVLDLIIRQWPVARFGYRADADGIHFCVNSPE